MDNIAAKGSPKKRDGIRESERGYLWGKLHLKRPRTALIFVTFLIVLTISVLVWTNSSSTSNNQQHQPVTQTPKAVIVDGLYSSSPNAAFLDNISTNLFAAGFRVDVYKGENATIDLLRNIGGYAVLILRLHSAIDAYGNLYIFSGEPFAYSKYQSDLLLGNVKRARDFNGNEYFAIDIQLLGARTQDSLKGSTIVLMGCNGTGSSRGVGGIIARGVNAFVGWNGYVDLSHSDQTTLVLIKALYSEKLSAEEAVQESMTIIGPDPSYKTVLECIISN